MSTFVLWQVHLVPTIIMTQVLIRPFLGLPPFRGNLPENEIFDYMSQFFFKLLIK